MMVMMIIDDYLLLWWLLFHIFNRVCFIITFRMHMAALGAHFWTAFITDMKKMLFSLRLTFFNLKAEIKSKSWRDLQQFKSQQLLKSVFPDIQVRTAVFLPFSRNQIHLNHCSWRRCMGRLIRHVLVVVSSFFLMWLPVAKNKAHSAKTKQNKTKTFTIFNISSLQAEKSTRPFSHEDLYQSVMGNANSVNKHK